jgi:ABC-type uncharacterized transport system permease subunit
MDWILYSWCVAGIVISILLPVLWKAVRVYFPANANVAGLGPGVESIWTVLKPYLILGLASALTALVLMFALGAEVASAKAAMLAGYAWDSTLQKLTKQ